MREIDQVISTQFLLDELVWQDLCRVLREPALITHELARAQMGEWLPQALQARRQTLRDVLAQLERQQARLLDLYLSEVVERAEFERKRKEVTQTQHGLTQQLRQLDAQAQQHVNVAALAQGIEAFCQRMHSTLDHLTFAQRRQLVELLIDRVIVNDAQVAIRYVVPTGPTGETTPFCHLRLDYLDPQTCGLQVTRRICRGPIRHHIQRVLLPFRPTTEPHNRPVGSFRHADIPQRDAGPWLETGCHGLASAAVPVPHDGDVAPCTDDGGPALCLDHVLATGPIKRAIPQHHHRRPRWDQRVHLCAQREMEVCGKVPLRTFPDLPHQWQSATCVDPMEHQCDTPTPHDAPSHHQDEGR